mmetsp:Transcript_51771/g.127100  ORF Transcript_51771/g.127100 Transcript_51771/m.127100 type:complete len:254 (-) Transcript_51771:312-1073(-)
MSPVEADAVSAISGSSRPRRWVSVAASNAVAGFSTRALRSHLMSSHTTPSGTAVQRPPMLPMLPRLSVSGAGDEPPVAAPKRSWSNEQLCSGEHVIGWPVTKHMEPLVAAVSVTLRASTRLSTATKSPLATTSVPFITAYSGAQLTVGGERDTILSLSTTCSDGRGTSSSPCLFFNSITNVSSGSGGAPPNSASAAFAENETCAAVALASAALGCACVPSYVISSNDGPSFGTPMTDASTWFWRSNISVSTSL